MRPPQKRYFGPYTTNNQGDTLHTLSKQERLNHANHSSNEDAQSGGAESVNNNNCHEAHN
jgi:hypothetical protein